MNEDAFLSLAAKWDVALSDAADPQTVLLASIAKKVRFWLDHDYEKLARVLYLLDVPESALHHALRTTPFAEVPEAVAILIIKREIEKAELRRKYSA